MRQNAGSAQWGKANQNVFGNYERQVIRLAKSTLCIVSRHKGRARRTGKESEKEIGRDHSR